MKTIPSESFKERVTTMNLDSEELRSAVVGMMLGDGCISKRHENGDAYFQMSHCEKQYEYLMWKKSILDNITSSSIHNTERTINGKLYKGFHLGTKVHPFFTKMYSRFYHDGIKVVDEYIVKKINELALAIWYMDDGTKGKNKRSENEKCSFYLCTNNFDYANQLLLKKSLKIKFGLDWNINKFEKSKDGSYNYRLRLAQRHNDAFVNIIRPFIIPSMQYKLDSYANQLEN